MEKRTSIADLKAMKVAEDRYITAYDYPSARLVEEAGVPLFAATASETSSSATTLRSL
jgi:ketopantoate hydroxymethyltransferase